MNRSPVLLLTFLILFNAEAPFSFVIDAVCQETTKEAYIHPDIRLRTFEVTISKQAGVRVKTDVFELKDKCKGVIINTITVLSTARCLQNINTNFQRYLVYSGYLYVNSSEGLAAKHITSVTMHPKYKENVNGNNVALITVEYPYDFGSPHLTGGLLPDNPLNFEAAFVDRMNCDLTGYQRYINHMYIVRVVELEAICNEDCRNRIEVLKLNISIPKNVTCIIQKNGSFLRPELLTEGTPIMVGKFVQGIIPHGKYTKWESEDPVPMIDIGNMTEWIRQQLINLHSSGCFPRCPNNNLFVFLLLLLLYLSLRIS